MATNALRSRDNPQLHTVRYIAQVDIDGWMVKRTKVGAKTNMFVVLEGTTLTILKNKSATARHVISVRATPPYVNVDQRELVVKLPGNTPGKGRPLRLFIPTQEETYRWKHALESAVNSDITDYYTFGKTLGCGAYGEVVEAFDVRTNERRAVKIIQRGDNMKSREHLECEIKVMQSISHENIVKTYQIFDLKRTIYIVMEHVQGGDLFDFVARHNSLTEAQGSQCLRSIFQAVSYLHRIGIVHRDLKPENILCANDTWPLEIKVTDFGFASFINPSDSDSAMRTQVGTAYFMAPEIINHMPHGPAVDSWACGVILYTILTGRLPFPGKNTREYFTNVTNRQPLFPAILWKGISADAMSLVKGLLNSDPNKRLTSLGALQHRWLSSPTTTYGDNEIRRDRSNLHSRRRRLFKARKAIIAVAMANKFKATIPQMVDKVGDGTKKVAEGIEKGVKKTADGIGEGVKKTAEGVKKVGDGIGEGTKKVAGGVGEGTKKMASGIAGGTKKVAEGIGTGVKKTVDGVETSAKKVGEGTKKVADGIESGFKKTAEGIETGFKKTGEGMKKTGEGIKRNAEKVKFDRERSRGGETGRSNTAGDSQTDSARGSSREARRRPLFRRRGQNTSMSSAVSESEPSRQGDVPMVTSAVSGSGPSRRENVAIRKLLVESGASADDGMNSSADFYSADEEHSDTEEGWRDIKVHAEGLDIGNVSAVTSKRLSSQRVPIDLDSEESTDFPDVDRGALNPQPTSFSKRVSNTSNSSAGSSRPKLPPLDGLTMGLSDECMAGTSRDALWDPVVAGNKMDGLWDPMPGDSQEAMCDNGNSGGAGETDTLRKTAALLLESMPSNGMIVENECTNTE